MMRSRLRTRLGPLGPSRVARTSAAVATLAAVLLSAVGAQATTIDSVDVTWLREHSELVVRGQVEGVEVLERGPDGRAGIHTAARVRVVETLSGHPSTFVTVWVPGGRLGRRARVVHGQATFEAGEEVVVFLHRHSGALWPTGMMFGKWRMAGAQVLSPLGSTASPLGALRLAIRSRAP